MEHLVKPAGAPPGPIVLVEPSDNIGGGAPGDGTAMLRFFVENNVDGAGVIINDPASVAALAKIKAGESLTLDIGGRENVASGGPLQLAVTLVSISDGRFEIEDRHSHLASMCGVNIDMGPCAVVRHAGITLLLTSRQTPPFDLGQWRSQGVDPAAFKVVAVKAAVAHRRAYDRITGATYTVDTPGPCSSNLRAFTFRHLRRPVYPLDEV
jgi:microcystin degradation protein MlrC